MMKLLKFDFKWIYFFDEQTTWKNAVSGGFLAFEKVCFGPVCSVQGLTGPNLPEILKILLVLVRSGSKLQIFDGPGPVVDF